MARRLRATLVLLNESGFCLQPLNCREWAPVGSGPKQVVSQRDDQLSVIGSLPRAATAADSPHFVAQDHNVQTHNVMRYLRQLHRIHKRPLVVVLDRLNVH